MFKHFKFRHFKKKRHIKKGEYENSKIIKKEPIPFFITFGVSAFGLLYFFVPLLLGLLVLGDFEIKYNNRFYPGVFVAGESVGGKTYEETLNHFKEKFDLLKKDGINLNLENFKEVKKEVNIPMTTSGLTSDNSIDYFTIGDWESELKNAYKWGHESNIFKNIGQQFSLLFSEKYFYFPVTIQKEAIDSLIDNELNNFFRKSVSAGFILMDNKISISKEEVGEDINKEEVLNIYKDKLSKFDITPILINTHEDIPEVTQKSLEPYLNNAQNISKKINLVFQYNGYKWNINGPKLITWLTIKKEGSLGINRIKLEEYFLNTISKSIVNPPRNSRFKIQDGKIIEVVSGRAGNAIDIEKVIEQLEKIVSEPEVNLDVSKKTIYIQIETVRVEPKVTKDTIEKYQIKDLVGEIRTNFDGSSSDREHNIKIGVSTITGVLIAPGEEFSTVSSIGPVTGKEGYVKELVIKENKTTKEYGGGLCQVATTLFRLALNAGLPITERQNHRFVVHYYDPPGLDATIYGPHPDFRFVNDTGNYLLLQARVENKHVIMELYGRKDNRTIEISKPIVYNKIPAPPTKYIQDLGLSVGQTKCTEAPHDGVTTDVLYTVNYPDGTIKKKNFKSIYQPWQKVCLVGAMLLR